MRAGTDTGDSPTPEQSEGQRLGGYLLGERVGIGGMAEIFHATCLIPGRHHPGPIVLKRMHPDLAENRDFVSMFVGDAKNQCFGWRIGIDGVAFDEPLGDHLGELGGDDASIEIRYVEVEIIGCFVGLNGIFVGIVYRDFFVDLVLYTLLSKFGVNAYWRIVIVEMAIEYGVGIAIGEHRWAKYIRGV